MRVAASRIPYSITFLVFFWCQCIRLKSFNGVWSGCWNDFKAPWHNFSKRRKQVLKKFDKSPPLIKLGIMYGEKIALECYAHKIPMPKFLLTQDWIEINDTIFIVLPIMVIMSLFWAYIYCLKNILVLHHFNFYWSMKIESFIRTINIKSFIIFIVHER